MLMIINENEQNDILELNDEEMEGAAGGVQHVRSIKNGVSVHAEPNENSRVILKVMDGFTLKYAGKTVTVDGVKWYKVLYGRGVGYICAKYAKMQKY